MFSWRFCGSSSDSTENVVLQVIALDPLVEGDNVTLKCVADGNPAPTSFNFHLKVLASQKSQESFCIRAALHAQSSLIWSAAMSPKDEVVMVENANTYIISNVTRETSGEYKCSLIDNPTIEASEDVVVKCKSAERRWNDCWLWWYLFSTLPCSNLWVKALCQLCSLCSAVCQILCMLTSKLFWGLSVLWNIVSPWFADLDVILSPSGTVIRNFGDTLDLSLRIDSSDATKVSWTKVKAFYVTQVKTKEKSWWSTHTTDVLLFGQDNVKLNKEPNFSKVSYSDSGRYECDVTMGLLGQKASFELVVEGKCS